MKKFSIILNIMQIVLLSFIIGYLYKSIDE